MASFSLRAQLTSEGAGVQGQALNQVLDLGVSPLVKAGSGPRCKPIPTQYAVSLHPGAICRLLGFKAWLGHFYAGWTWANYLTALCSVSSPISADCCTYLKDPSEAPVR